MSFKMEMFSQCFNTQPPEGGWQIKTEFISRTVSFNTQPPEGGWEVYTKILTVIGEFQHTAA